MLLGSWLRRPHNIPANPSSKGPLNTPPRWQSTSPPARNGNQPPGDGFGLNALSSSWMHQDIYAMSLPRAAIPRPEPPAVPCHARPSLPHVETPKNLLTPEQILSLNDGSEPARFPLRKRASRLGDGSCCSGLAKCLLAALQGWILKKLCKSLVLEIFCLGISISAAHHAASV